MFLANRCLDNIRAVGMSITVFNKAYMFTRH